jgi:uncharacterized protein
MGKKNVVGHVEWRTRDTERLKSFYGKIFKWKFKDAMPGIYTQVSTGNREITGGILQLQAGEQIPTGTSNYISVDDLADAESKILEQGGKVLMSKNEVPGEGWFSVFTDPDGNVMAVWQAMSKKERKAQKKALKAAQKATKQVSSGDKTAKKAAKKAKKKAKKADRDTQAAV